MPRELFDFIAIGPICDWTQLLIGPDQGRRQLSLPSQRGAVVWWLACPLNCHAAGRGSIPGPGALLGVKTWLSTLEIVYLSVFRMRN